MHILVVFTFVTIILSCLTNFTNCLIGRFILESNSSNVVTICSHEGIDGKTPYKTPIFAKFTINKDPKCDFIAVSCPIFDINRKDKFRMITKKLAKSSKRNAKPVKRRIKSWSKHDSVQKFDADVLIVDFSGRKSRENNLNVGFECKASCNETAVAPSEEEIQVTHKTSNCECGRPRRRNKIVGGTETEINEYPWHVGLEQVTLNEKTNEKIRTLFCGGAIISSRWIISAAHCLYFFDKEPKDLFVLVEDHDIKNSNETKAKRHGVERLFIHSSYNANSLKFDIALIKLSEPIMFEPVEGLQDSIARPICMPKPMKSQKPLTKAKLIVTGWGAVNEGGPTSHTLQEVELKHVPMWKCRQMYAGLASQSVNIYSSMVCAYANNKDSCQGDSGGPLITDVNEDGTYELYGVVSFGIGCARPQFPGVYTFVPAYMKWINKVTTDVNNIADDDMNCEAPTY